MDSDEFTGTGVPPDTPATHGQGVIDGGTHGQGVIDGPTHGQGVIDGGTYGQGVIDGGTWHGFSDVGRIFARPLAWAWLRSGG